MWWVLIALAASAQIVLAPNETACYFVWKFNYSDDMPLTVGTDFIEVGGIRVHANCQKPVEIDVVKWNPSLKSVDGAIVLEFVVSYHEPAEVSVIVENLAPSFPYTILRDGAIEEVVIANESGAIAFTCYTGSSHTYTVISGALTAPIETTTEAIVIAPPEETLLEKIVNALIAHWMCLIAVMLILLFVLVVWLRSR